MPWEHPDQCPEGLAWCRLLPGQVKGVPASDGRLLPPMPSPRGDSAVGARELGLERHSEAPEVDDLIRVARPHLARSV